MVIYFFSKYFVLKKILFIFKKYKTLNYNPFNKKTWKIKLTKAKTLIAFFTSNIPFNRPMGIAIKPDRFSIGCLKTVENYQNIPSLISRLEEPEKYDSCYVPRSVIETGAIDIHEMAWGNNDSLWIVNTKHLKTK